jgi:hypothetical protein
MTTLLDIALKILGFCALWFFTELCYQASKCIRAKRKLYERDLQVSP